LDAGYLYEIKFCQAEMKISNFSWKSLKNHTQFSVWTLD